MFRVPRSALRCSAFTLLELLAVISIIAILAALLLTALVHAKDRTREAKSKLDVGKIVNAISSYEADNHRLPVSREAMSAALAKNEDFTYGTTGVANMPNPGDAGLGFVTPTAVTLPIVASDAATSTLLSYQANNSELVAILMDIERVPATQAPTVNFGHVKNTTHTPYLHEMMTGDQNSPGIGSDLVCRDPWRQPYIISLDLNGDGKTRDPFYRMPNVSADPGNPSVGINGLIKSPNGNFFEVNQEVMVWSAGKDRQIDPNPSNAPGGKANIGANKNNITSWGQ